MKALYFYLACLLFSPPLINAQQAYKIGKNTTTSVLGTSTLHDWESEVENISGTASFTLEEGSLKTIESLEVSFLAKSIKSDKSRMDNITYDAIKADDFPKITFNLKRFEAGTDNTVTAYGTLSIAGEKQEVAIEGTTSLQNNTVIIDGIHPIKLTNYGIEPPTAMFGTIKVGDDLRIKFHLEFTR